MTIHGLLSRSFKPFPSLGTKSGFDCKNGALGIASASERKGEAPSVKSPIDIPDIIENRNTWVSVIKKSTGPRYGLRVHFMSPNPIRVENKIQSMKLPS